MYMRSIYIRAVYIARGFSRSLHTFLANGRNRSTYRELHGHLPTYLAVYPPDSWVIFLANFVVVVGSVFTIAITKSLEFNLIRSTSCSHVWLVIVRSAAVLPPSIDLLCCRGYSSRSLTSIVIAYNFLINTSPFSSKAFLMAFWNVLSPGLSFVIFSQNLF